MIAFAFGVLIGFCGALVVLGLLLAAREMDNDL